ncbi:zinc-ribbon domain-containing protein [Subtercola boreus]|nr:zinc-ribbon domain-containing protein [Subtercola boreus]
MLLIFGSRISEAIINMVTFVCGYCHQQAPQNVIKRSNRFTLFFVPLFPFSTKYVNQCTNCGGLTELTADQARHSLEWAEAQR